MAISISTPTVADAQLKSFAGLNSEQFQVVGAVPFNRVPVAATQANSQISVASTALLLNTYKPAGATHAEIAVETQAIRWWDDGKSPTASQGKPLAVGDYL